MDLAARIRARLRSRKEDPEKAMVPREDLFSLTLDEISVVPQGDNSGAHIMLTKRAPEDPPELSDEEFERLVDELIEEEKESAQVKPPAKPGGSTTAKKGSMTTQQKYETPEQVEQAVTKIASQLRRQNAELSEATARYKAWQEENLREQHRELVDARISGEAGSSVTAKSQTRPLSEIEEDIQKEAGDVLRRHPAMSDRAARQLALRSSPALRREYREASAPDYAAS